MVAVAVMPAKLATLGPLKVIVFLNKVYDVIISVHDVANKILPRDSNYIEDLVI